MTRVGLTATVLVAVALLLARHSAAGETVEQILAELNAYPHAVSVAQSEGDVVDYELGLGTIKKVRGVWQFKDSVRLSGHLSRYTWQIVDGFTSAEVLQGLVERLEQGGGVQTLFSCQGRACGSGAQWANRVFRQRILYGRDDLQHYRVLSLGDNGRYRLVLYSAERTADRQYLHADLLRLAD